MKYSLCKHVGTLTETKYLPRVCGWRITQIQWVIKVGKIIKMYRDLNANIANRYVVCNGGKYLTLMGTVTCL